MTENQILSLRIGSPFSWTIPDRTIDHTDENAIAYGIDGLPETIRAALHALAAGIWRFAVDGPTMHYHSSGSFTTKEAAFEGLKDWLKATEF